MIAKSDLYDMAYIEKQLKAGEMHIWPMLDCVALTEFLFFPKAKVLNVFGAAGRKGFSLRQLTRGLEPRLVNWGRDNGCTKIVGYGLKMAWRPITEGMGYSHLWTVMSKDI